MAALNFPDPNESTTYQANGLTYQWNGTTWKNIASGFVGSAGPVGYTGSASIDYTITIVACSDETTAITVGPAKATFRAVGAYTLVDVRASLSNAQVSGNILTVDINKNGNTILSTKLTIDNNEKTSVTANVAAVISETAVADDDEISIDVDALGDGTATGLKVSFLWE